MTNNYFDIGPLRCLRELLKNLQEKTKASLGMGDLNKASEYTELACDELAEYLESTEDDFWRTYEH